LPPGHLHWGPLAAQDLHLLPCQGAWPGRSMQSRVLQLTNVDCKARLLSRIFSHRFFTARLYIRCLLSESIEQDVKMKKYRVYAVVLLLAAPSILVSGPGFSTSSLPAIDGNVKPLLQQNCPVEGDSGCFNSLRPSPVAFCRQFMQMFLRPGGG
jgi:hypothetical protein